MTIEQVHQMLLGRAKQFNESGVSMIDGLEIAERTQVYLRYGYSTLWSYCEHALKLSPADTQRFLQVMRKAKVFPELKKAVVSGTLSVPKAARIASQLTVENQTQWIETAVSLSSRKLDIAVKDKNPGAIPRERITPRGNDIFDFKIGLSKSALDKFNRISDILSQKLRRPATAQEILEFSFDETLKKHDPIQKAQRNQSPKRAHGLELVFKELGSRDELSPRCVRRPDSRPAAF